MTNWTAYRAAMTAKREELIRHGYERDEIAVERLPDTIDDVQHTTDLYLTVSSLNRNWQSVRAIDQALQRIADGTYGQCQSCEEPISEKRLAAIPWASLCRTCQERQDSQGVAA